jgi:hypothetical protein
MVSVGRGIECIIVAELNNFFFHSLLYLLVP